MGYQEVQALQQQINSQLSSPKGGIGLDVQSWQGGAPLRQQPQKSVLGLLDRAKYGFADDIGQQQIIMNATGKRPIKLQNGQYGVEDIGPNGQKVIRPVDPKGFQMNDLVGDISESLGKGITTGGGILGGITGSVPGAGAGAGAGELVRQQIGNLLGVRGTEVEPGKFAKTGFGQMDNEDFAEIAGESILGAAGQGVANKLTKTLGSLLAPGVKPAVSAVDDIPKAGTTQVANQLADDLGLKNTNSEIVRKFYQYPSKFKIANNIDELAANLDTELTNIVENKNSLLFQRHLEPELKRVAQAQGVQNVDEVALDMSTAVNDLRNLKKQMLKDPTVTDLIKKERRNTINQYIRMTKNNPDTTYGQFKQIGQNIFDEIQTNKDNPAIKKSLTQIYDTLVENRAKTLSPDAFKKYSTDRGTFDKLDKLFKVRLSEGELVPGQISLVGKLGKFTDEIKQASNYNTLQDIIQQGKQSGVEGIEKLGDSIDEYLFNLGLSKAKPGKGSLRKLVQGTPVLEGVANTVGDLINDPRNKARMLQKLFQANIFDPSKTTARVSETLFPRVQTLAELVNARRLLEQGIPLPDVIKKVSKPVAKVLRQTAKNKGVQGQVVTRSLNEILFKGDMTSE